MDGLSAEITVRVIGPIAYASDFADLLDPLGRLSVQQHWLTNSGLLLGAYLGDRPCGLAMMSFEHRCDLVADLPYLFVAEEYRRQGVGRALLAECIAAAKAKGFRAYELGTPRIAQTMPTSGSVPSWSTTALLIDQV